LAGDTCKSARRSLDEGRADGCRSHAASSRISRTCAGPAIGRGLRGTHGVSIASSAMRAKLSAPILTAPRLRGIAEPGDEGAEHVAGILPWMAHRGGDHGLTLGVDRFVPVRGMSNTAPMLARDPDRVVRRRLIGIVTAEIGCRIAQRWLPVADRQRAA